MRAIILAAGQGTRMLPLTRDVPKSLLPLGDSTILGRLVTQLMAAGVTAITVVVGHEADRVAAEVRTASQGHASIVVNEGYLQDVNILSLNLALEQDPSPFLLLEADCIFTDRAMASILAGSLDGSSVWFACGDFRSKQAGGVIGAHDDGAVFDVDIIPKWEAKYADYKKMVGVLAVGDSEAPLFAELLDRACSENTRQYYHMPWIHNLKRLPCRVVDLGTVDAVSVNTVQEYEAIARRFAT